MSGTVQGIKELLVKFESHKKKSARLFRVGLLRGGLFLQRASQKIVPVDTGALRASANTRAEGEGFDTEVIVSYGTNYGVYVHEILENRHAPGKQAKYLEQPTREKRQRIGQIVAKAMRGGS